MNKQEMDIMYTLLTEGYENQRVLAQATGHSLGLVNRALRQLRAQGLLDEENRPTEIARREAQRRAPKNAVILAAGFGMRMVPINTEVSKGLLEVHGERLIERLIRQLREAGVRDITVVVGYMMEKYEYLIDEFGVRLKVSPEYAVKNNIHSLYRVRERLGNTYIMPCDLWCEENPFRACELYSWYMVSSAAARGSLVRVNRRGELVTVKEQERGNVPIGIAYLLEDDAAAVRRRLEELCADPGHDGLFWEAALYDRGRLTVQARVAGADKVVEINTYEQLRELDAGSGHLQSKALSTIAAALGCEMRDIVNIEVLKKGMTNRSFLFTAKGSKYIMRIPGEGTEKLINRQQEAQVYAAIAGRGLCDDPAFLDPDTGYKITRFLPGVRTCDPDSEEDLRRCMAKLRQFHGMRLTVDHEFDIFGQIEFYETLWDGAPSVYKDYAQTKRNILSLRDWLEAHAQTRCLTHIDAVCDNFLFCRDERGGEQLQLTDWEYAGMQDPHVDVAMFCIYSLYDREQVDRLIDIYFEGACPPDTRRKIYGYIAACGLLWSNWSEYKRHLGVEFGEYGLRQYRYAKEYYRLMRGNTEDAEGWIR